MIRNRGRRAISAVRARARRLEGIPYRGQPMRAKRYSDGSDPSLVDVGDWLFEFGWPGIAVAALIGVGWAVRKRTSTKSAKT